MRLALYQPDIPQNTGTILRLAACLGIEVDIIEPCGFVFDDRRLKRSGMDYLEHVTLTRHSSWETFSTQHFPGRLILLTTRGSVSHTEFTFKSNDILLLGQESRGVPEEVHAAAEARVYVPLRPGLRSLNVALAAALVVGEAARQIGLFHNFKNKTL